MKIPQFVGIAQGGQQLPLSPMVELEYTDTWGVCAQILTARFLWEKTLPELVYLNAFWEGELVFSGIVDQQELLLQQGTRFLEVQARGMGALLLDNEALPQTYVNVTLSQIYARHIQPYGFGDIQCGRDPLLSYYTVPKGASEWEVLETFCLRTMGVVPRVDALGQLWVGQAETPQVFFLSNRGSGIPYLQLRDTTKQREVLSQVVVRDSQYVYGTAVDNPWGSTLPRRRYLIPASEWANYPSGNALLKLREAMAAKWSLAVTVPQLLPAAPGDLVTLEDDVLPVSRQFVRQVRHTMGSAGALTHLTLGDGQYFNP